MNYIGNKPTIELTNLTRSFWNYISPINPTTSINPSSPYNKFLNSTSGEEFVCIDNTINANIWKGQLGTTVGP